MQEAVVPPSFVDHFPNSIRNSPRAEKGVGCAGEICTMTKLRRWNLGRYAEVIGLQSELELLAHVDRRSMFISLESLEKKSIEARTFKLLRAICNYAMCRDCLAQLVGFSAT